MVNRWHNETMGKLQSDSHTRNNPSKLPSGSGRQDAPHAAGGKVSGNAKAGDYEGMVEKGKANKGYYEGTVVSQKSSSKDYEGKVQNKTQDYKYGTKYPKVDPGADVKSERDTDG